MSSGMRRPGLTRPEGHIAVERTRVWAAPGAPGRVRGTMEGIQGTDPPKGDRDQALHLIGFPGPTRRAPTPGVPEGA